MSEVKIFKGFLPDNALIKNGEEITIVLAEDTATLVVQASIVKDDITIAVPLKTVAMTPRPIVFNHERKKYQLEFGESGPQVERIRSTIRGKKKKN